MSEGYILLLEIPKILPTRTNGFRILKLNPKINPLFSDYSYDS
jgi:hypothetical protein